MKAERGIFTLLFGVSWVVCFPRNVLWSGGIPREICQLKKLRKLVLINNRLTGEFAESVAAKGIGRLFDFCSVVESFFDAKSSCMRYDGFSLG